MLQDHFYPLLLRQAGSKRHESVRLPGYSRLSGQCRPGRYLLPLCGRIFHNRLLPVHSLRGDDFLR